MIPTADPTPNALTATTLLVASDSMPSAVVALAPKQRRREVRDRGLERVLDVVHVADPALLVPVLHDVHVVGNRQHDDERHEHAREHVVAETHQRVQPERPEEADEDREHGEQASSATTGTRGRSPEP